MSIANEVRLYLKNKPYILEALEKGIVNLSELSRRVQKELGVKNFHAIKAALRRYSEKIRKEKRRREEKVLAVLKGSRMVMVDGVSVLITSEDMNIENKAKVKLNSYYVYLLYRRKIENLKKKFKNLIIDTHENCSAVIITSGRDIEKVPGVVAYITSLLAEEGINVIEFISCYTETVIIIERKDALKTYEILSNIIG